MAVQSDVKQFSSDKILKHLDRVNEWLQGGNPYPITVEIDMTNHCNHKCPECVSGYFQRANDDFLPRELAERVIRELSLCGIRGLIFTGGGEPLLHPDTMDMVELAANLGIDIGFITNSSLLNEERCRILLKNCVWVRVSLDATNPELFKRTHGVGGKAFEKVVENTRMLARMKRELKSNCTVGVGYLTSDDTKDEMVNAARLGGELGVDYLQFRPLQVHRGGKFDYHWTDVNNHIEQAFQYSTNGYDVLFSKHKYEMMKTKDYGRNYKVCYGHQFATTIAASGKMYLCCHTRDYDKYCIGDLKVNSFREIWESEQRKKAIEGIDFRDCIPLCRDNTFNQVLWNIEQSREHVNFL